MTTRNKHSLLWQQLFRKKEVSFCIQLMDGAISITSDNASKSLLAKLKNEIVYDGYVESGEVDHGIIRLSNPDLWNCNIDELKDLITLKLEEENYEVTFFS